MTREQQRQVVDLWSRRMTAAEIADRVGVPVADVERVVAAMKGGRTA